MRLAARLERLEKRQALRVAEWEKALDNLSKEEFDAQLVATIHLYEAEHGEVEPMAADIVIPRSQWSKLTDWEFIGMMKRDMQTAGVWSDEAE